MCSGRMADEITWAPSPLCGSAAWFGGTGGGRRTCEANAPTAQVASDSQELLFCAPFGNPNRGMTSFDTILWAWISVFQIITQVTRGSKIQARLGAERAQRGAVSKIPDANSLTLHAAHAARLDPCACRRGGQTSCTQPRRRCPLGCGSTLCCW